MGLPSIAQSAVPSVRAGRRQNESLGMNSQFDATASMLGYLFQVRVVLLDSLKRLRARQLYRDRRNAR